MIQFYDIYLPINGMQYRPSFPIQGLRDYHRLGLTLSNVLTVHNNRSCACKQLISFSLEGRLLLLYYNNVEQAHKGIGEELHDIK